MEGSSTPIAIASIEGLHRVFGLRPPDHPLYSVVKIERIGQLPITDATAFILEFFAVVLLGNLQGEIHCGRKSYDFQKGILICLAPGLLIEGINSLANVSARFLFFHRDFLAGHPLSYRIQQYGFFDYTTKEALHLSQKEEISIEQLFQNIQAEYTLPVDAHSHHIILSNLDLLLTYCNRYHSRQFITRNQVESHFQKDFERLLQTYLSTKSLREHGIPSVEQLAMEMNTSPKYLSDKLRVLTGKRTQEHIHIQILARAKSLLRENRLSISEIAFQLGFEYPQYFSRLFKKKVGISPKEYRNMN
ncbi:MAG: helix-turn-helix transcriptional regulator [Bacteroidota bacterium]